MADPNTTDVDPQRPRYTRRFLLVPVLIVVILGGYQFYLSRQRPMFANHYGKNDRMFFKQWIHEPPIIDRRGNALKADYPSNLLVLFLMEDPNYDVAAFWFPRPMADGVAFHGQNDVQFNVPTQSNTFVIFDPQGNRVAFTMAEGTAERLHASLHRQNNNFDDLRPLVEGAVSKGERKILRALFDVNGP